MTEILLVGNFLSASSGTRSVCEDLADRLPAIGWSVHTTSSKPGRLLRLLDMISTVWRLRRRYAVAQVDVYSGLAFIWAEIVCSVLRQIRKPYILTLHGGNLPLFSQRWPGRVRRILQSAAVVTTPSPYLLDHMRRYRADLHLLPNPLDLSALNCRLRTQPQARLVWLRAFHAIYNPAMAVEVVALLARDVPNVQLIMIGPDKADGSLPAVQALAAELGVQDRITIHGSIPKADVGRWLHTGDIFLNTANIDNTPVSVLEAMACGLCVVSTNVGGLPYLLEHERDALLVPPSDSAAMASAVRRVLTEPELATQLSSRARIKVEQFDWAIILPHWKTLLSNLAERREL
jgi:glycosyltransferase involved in cell wall biosynthesis